MKITLRNQMLVRLAVVKEGGVVKDKGRVFVTEVKNYLAVVVWRVFWPLNGLASSFDKFAQRFVWNTQRLVRVCAEIYTVYRGENICLCIYAQRSLGADYNDGRGQFWLTSIHERQIYVMFTCWYKCGCQESCGQCAQVDRKQSTKTRWNHDFSTKTRPTSLYREPFVLFFIACYANVFVVEFGWVVVEIGSLCIYAQRNVGLGLNR